MDAQQRALAEIATLAAELAATESRRDEVMHKARALGVTAKQVSDAAKMAPATYYRLAGKRRADEKDPARFHHLAPALVLEQPAEGLTVGIGRGFTRPPAATFTFNKASPVLLLLGSSTPAVAAVEDLWPVIAASAAISDARVRIYGRPPRLPAGIDLPNYLGNWGEFAGYTDLISEFAARIARIRAGEDLAPILVAMIPGGDRDGLAVVNTALAFGHLARMYLIAEDWHWHPKLAPINAVLALGGTSSGPWSAALPDMIPAIPNRLDAAILSTPEGVQHLALPLDAPNGQGRMNPDA